MRISAKGMYYRQLNAAVAASEDKEIIIDDCCGQRYIGDGLSGKTITINGVPGNALGAYMDDCCIIVNGNAQDATGDTMNSGRIFINGSSGDATGYAMRGGHIYVRGNVGYRAGIHMKEYQHRRPVLIIGGSAGSFLGEYQAGGIIIVLGTDKKNSCPVGPFCGTGMHGGVIYIRSAKAPVNVPEQVSVTAADKHDLSLIASELKPFCEQFGMDEDEIMSDTFYALRPNTKNPYKHLYTHN